MFEFSKFRFSFWPSLFLFPHGVQARPHSYSGFLKDDQYRFPVKAGNWWNAASHPDGKWQSFPTLEFALFTAPCSKAI